MFVVSTKRLLRMQHHAMRTKCWGTFAGTSEKLMGCCKEELTTDGIVVALSFCLSARPTHAPPYLTALYVLHINSLSFVCGHDVILIWHNKGLITIGFSIIVTSPFLYCCNKRQGSSVGVVTILRGEQQGNVGSTPGRNKRYSLFHGVQTCSGSHTGFLSDA